MVTEASPTLERLDLFNYGEPFLHKELVPAPRHIQQVQPHTGIAISTDGMQVRESVEATIIQERLLDWIIFSVDGCDDDSYRRYRIEEPSRPRMPT